MSYEEIQIDLIKSNPHNPRVTFAGPKFEDLVNSIREKGILEPILVRPVNGNFEVVAGERRFRARKQIFEEQKKLVDTIPIGSLPAIVRELNDDEAFEIMTIENLQREDLTPLEEAWSFETYAKRHGKDGIETLAEKTGIRPTFIRRRIAALRLPKRALEAWNKGIITFGHLEELIRLKDKQDMKETLDRLLSGGWRDITTKDLREMINNRIPLLTKATFDKTECASCMQNSDVQKKLWDIESMKKTHCLNPKCFTKKQTAYLTKTWPETEHAKRFKTTGFVFDHDLGWNDSNIMYYGAFKKCKKGCKDFKTILKLDGTVKDGKACIKNQDCFHSQQRSKTATDSAAVRKEQRAGGGPRVNWHGQHFREEFFKEHLPEKFKSYEPDDVKMLRAALYAMIKIKHDLHDKFAIKTGLAKKSEHYCVVEESKLFGAIAKMKKAQLFEAIQELSLETLNGYDLGAEGRRLLAEHLGIDLSKEWSPPEDFYQMKTIGELLDYGEKAGILDDAKAQTFLTETLKKKKFTALKKAELVRVFKEAGITLTGKVPEEILGKGEEEDDPTSWEDESEEPIDEETAGDMKYHELKDEDRLDKFGRKKDRNE